MSYSQLHNTSSKSFSSNIRGTYWKHFRSRLRQMSSGGSSHQNDPALKRPDCFFTIHCVILKQRNIHHLTLWSFVLGILHVLILAICLQQVGLQRLKFWVLRSNFSYLSLRGLRMLNTILHSWICKVFVDFYIWHVQPAHWQKPRCCGIDGVPFAVDWHQSTNEGLGIGYGPMELGYFKSRSSSKGSIHEDKRGSGNYVYVLTQYPHLLDFICFMLQGQFQAINFLGKINL